VIDLPPPSVSVQDRPIAVHRRGGADAARRVLVVGSVHGDEPGGKAVTRALLERAAPPGTAIYVVHDLNPDAARRGTRVNARGVDLNRNFPHRWRTGPRGRFHPGPRAASEPETRYAMRLTREIDPHVTVWLHQPYGIVVPGAGSSTRLVRRYARAARLPVRRLPRYRGTAVGWQNTTQDAGGAFVVELRAGQPSTAVVRRHVAAVHAVARGETATARAAQAAPKPPIRWNPIPFGLERKRQTKRYAKRHYGLNTHLLRAPKVIGQHFTASSSFASAFSTFVSNAPNVGEKPGVCAHFVIDRDGTIHQLVSLRFMCRHIIGLNHTAIGIEHVGTSDAGVMGNRRQLDASLRLTRWLRARYGVKLADVVGHAESLKSEHYREDVPSFRGQTHADFQPATMRRYRRMLTAGG
jgi:beta-N-acetylhexosaminidase